jgi:hypothetical protein
VPFALYGPAKHLLGWRWPRSARLSYPGRAAEHASTT